METESRNVCKDNDLNIEAYHFKGITPYQYLSTIRINHAKKLLMAGAVPIEAALQSGYSARSISSSRS